MVVLFHLTTLGNHSSVIFNLGCTGVDLFFIISGFVILMTLERCKSWKDFLISRFARLYPAYWTAVTFTALLIVITVVCNLPHLNYGISVKQYLVNMTMLQHWFKVRNVDGPYWTLTIELVFYFLMLLVFISGRLKNIELIGIPFLLLSFCYGLFETVFNSNALLHVISVAFPLIAYFPLFYAGIIMYKIKQETASPFRILMLLLCMGTQIYLFDKFHHNHTAISVTQYGSMLVAYFIIFLLFVYEKLDFIAIKPSLFYGRISYSLYLIHQFLSAGVLLPLLTGSWHLNFWLAVIIILAVNTLIAYLINRYIENVSLHFIKNRYSKK
ncbi:membrane protein [Filimonas lacunae]|nr:membrane protein [Filimonas lacunae]